MSMAEYYAIKDAETLDGGTDWTQVPQRFGGTRPDHAWQASDRRDPCTCPNCD